MDRMEWTGKEWVLFLFRVLYGNRQHNVIKTCYHSPKPYGIFMTTDYISIHNLSHHDHFVYIQPDSSSLMHHKYVIAISESYFYK